MHTSQRCAPLVSSTAKRHFREVQTVLNGHSIEIRLLESGRVFLWHMGPFGGSAPREYDDLQAVVDEQLPLTKDDRLHAYTGG